MSVLLAFFFYEGGIDDEDSTWGNEGFKSLERRKVHYHAHLWMWEYRGSDWFIGDDYCAICCSTPHGRAIGRKKCGIIAFQNARFGKEAAKHHYSPVRQIRRRQVRVVPSESLRNFEFTERIILHCFLFDPLECINWGHSPVCRAGGENFNYRIAKALDLCSKGFLIAAFVLLIPGTETTSVLAI